MLKKFYDISLTLNRVKFRTDYELKLNQFKRQKYQLFSLVWAKLAQGLNFTVQLFSSKFGKMFEFS